MRQWFFGISISLCATAVLLGIVWPTAFWAFVILVPLIMLGVRDSVQTRRAVLRNFPVIGHFRYLFEKIRPEINQYFIESNTDGKPFSRNQRSVVYQRAKQELETVPFGTQRDVYEIGYEWLNHSIIAREAPENPRIRIGEGRCRNPYEASVFNISAMSFGSLSANAVRALNGGAKLGGFYHNTGEGGISGYHLEHGGDLVWQIGTGYFGCRKPDGTFCKEEFAKNAAHETVRMIEVKLSQGAKPGHGGILPAKKVTEEIARIRGVAIGEDVLSPPYHSKFDTPIGLLEFVEELREISGKPVGFKLCIGHRAEFLGICKAMVASKIIPDFICVDGGEGGTGAAPVEFSNSVGTPLTDALVFVHNALEGFGLRQQTCVIASGKIITGFQIAQRIAAGADLCNSARGFMFALGCIQALRCNANDCPVGVATQKEGLTKGLVVTHKTERVANFHKATVHAFLETLGAAGLTHPNWLRPWHIHRRVSATSTKTYTEIYRYLKKGDLLGDDVDQDWRRSLSLASADSFRPQAQHESSATVT